MSISNLRNLSANRDIPDLSPSRDNQLAAKFLLILEEIFDQKQSDKFNNHYGLESVANIYAKSIASLYDMPIRPDGSIENAVMGSGNELLISMGIQAGMIYDLGCAFHSKMYVLKEQIVEIMIGAYGGPVNLTGNSIFVNVSGKLDVSNEKLVDKIKMLFEYVEKEANDFTIVSSLQIPPNIYRRVWLKNKTLDIARLTRRFYLNELLQIEEKVAKRLPMVTKKINFEKIKGLSNLLKAGFDHKNNSSELFKDLLEFDNWSLKEKKQLTGIIDSHSEISPIDIQPLIDHNHQVKLCLELIILAKRNKEIDRGERLYIYSYGKKIDWDHHQIDSLLLQ